MIYKVSTKGFSFCDLEFDGNKVIGAGIVNPGLDIEVTVDRRTGKIDVNIGFIKLGAALIIRKFNLAHGQPKSDFWKKNIDEFNSLICESDSDASQSDGPTSPRLTLQGRTNDLYTTLKEIMDSDDPQTRLVVGSVSDVQFIDSMAPESPDGTRMLCKHDRVIIIRNAFLALSDGEKRCYAEMSTKIGKAVTDALKGFIISRSVIYDGVSSTRITASDLENPSHNCAIDTLFHLINYVQLVLLGQIIREAKV